jgi:hypothetical protein
MRTSPFYSRRASEITDDFVKNDSVLYGDPLKDGIVTREELEFHFFVEHGFDGSWMTEFIKRNEKFPLQPINAYATDEARFFFVAEFVGSTPDEIRLRYDDILDRLTDYFNRRGERQKLKK